MIDDLVNFTETPGKLEYMKCKAIEFIDHPRFDEYAQLSAGVTILGFTTGLAYSIIDSGNIHLGSLLGLLLCGASSAGYLGEYADSRSKRKRNERAAADHLENLFRLTPDDAESILTGSGYSMETIERIIKDIDGNLKGASTEQMIDAASKYESEQLERKTYDT